MILVEHALEAPAPHVGARAEMRHDVASRPRVGCGLAVELRIVAPFRQARDLSWHGSEQRENLR